MSKRSAIATVLTGLGVLAAAAGVVSIQGPEKSIEVHIFDKDKTEKKIRFSAESFSPASLEIYKGDKWTSEIDSNDREMHNVLMDVAGKYLKFQTSLNLIKTSSPNFEKSFENPCKKESCKDCDCKDKKCATCLCCYLEDGKCCGENNQCKTDDFKKRQKTFAHLLKNPSSGTYLTPLRAYIKFPDLKFDELKNQTDEKPFIASLAYGFTDYWYAPVKYKGPIQDSEKDKYEQLEEGKDYYFANIPQRFLFSKDSKDSDKETNIRKLASQIEDQTKIENLIKAEAENCCKEEKLDCMVKRNLFFMEKDKLDNISNTIKEAEDCCNKAK